MSQLTTPGGSGMKGIEERLCVDDEGASMSFDRMTLWIDGKEVDSRGYPAV